MRNHIGCICLTFPWCVLSNVSSNRLHESTLVAFESSPLQCVSNCVLTMRIFWPPRAVAEKVTLHSTSRSRKIPGFHVKKSRDFDRLKIPGSRDSRDPVRAWWVVMLIVKLYMWSVYGWPIWKGRPKKQKSLLVCASPCNRPLKTKHLLICDGYFDHNMSQTGYSVGILLVFTKDFAFGFPKRISKDGLSKKIFPRPSGWDTLAWSRSR